MALAWSALALACAGCATTGSVSGRVTTPGKKGAPGAVVTAARSDTTVDQHPDTPQATLVVTDGQFLPAVLLVDPGTVVHIENRDRVFHNAFSVASNAPFDVGGIAPGKSASVRLERPGVLKVFCEFHRKECATVIVAPSRARTRPMPDGTYRLGGLPAGTYKVSAWHPKYGTKSTLVAVAARSQVTVNFRY
jgi:plastocyanin